MKRHLAIISTYFQLMVICNIAVSTKKYKDDIWDLCITDFSKNSKIVAEKLKNIERFSNVFFKEIKRPYYEDRNFKRILYALNTRSSIRKIFPEIFQIHYDYFWFYNINIFSCNLFDILKHINDGILSYRFEEGFSSYLSNTIPTKLSMLLKAKYTFRKKYSLIQNTDCYWVFNKYLLKWNPKCKIKIIQKFDRACDEFGKILSEIFETESAIQEYDRKYIFFEESFSCRNFHIDDIKLISEIANIVGHSNLMIKRHPRVIENRFKSLNLKVNEITDIPWEAIRYVADFAGKRFLSISSGSVLSSSLYFKDRSKSFLLFNCTDTLSDMVTDKYIDYISDISKFEFIIIPENIESLKVELQADLIRDI